MLDHTRADTAPENPREGIEKRRHTRHSVAWPATCFAEGGERFEALIVNVSEGGFGLKGPGPALDVNSTLFVDFEQIGTFRCRVAWSHDNRFGVEILDDQAADDPTQTFNLVDVLQRAKPKRGGTD